ncbi:unnamed protein product [Lathyrus sativus]|nr:unnamed protein product [Lathyrus sativus]
MVNNIWVLHNERTQNNGRNYPNECVNQISNNHSSPNTHIKTLQNPFTNLNNYNQNSPYGEASNHNNNSILFNDSTTRSRIDLNSYHGLKSVAISHSNSPLFRPIKSKDLDLFFSSENDTAHSAKHHVFDIRETDAWKKSMAQNKELFLFKDDKNTISVIKNGAKESDDEDLDLSLHL